MRLLTYIGRQFRQPTGFGGQLSTFVMNRINQKQYRAIESALRLGDADRVLDIGFGNGYFLRRLAGKYHSRFWGIDISDDMRRAAAARNRNSIEAGRMALSVGDVVHMDFPDGAFDKVYTSHTVYFWSDLDQGLAEIWRVLKGGGLFVNAVNSKEVMDKIPVTKTGFAKYTLAELEEAGRRAGFTVETAAIVPGKMYCLLYRKP